MIGRDHGSLNHRLWMDIWVVGGFDDYKSSCYKHFYAVFVCEYKSSLFWDKCLEISSLGRLVVARLVFLETANLFSRKSAPCYIPSSQFFHILTSIWYQFSQFSCSVVSDSLRTHESQHARPPCLSPTPRVYSNLCPLSQWCHPAVSSSVIPFSSCPQSLPASGSFPMSQLFAWGGLSIGVSALPSVLPVNTQDWSPLG